MAKLTAVTALAAAAATGSMAVPSAHAATTQASISASTRHVQAATAATDTFPLDNTDPIDTGCWDANAYIAAAAPIYDYPTGNLLGYVRNWYSPDCGTNWSEVYTADGSSNYLGPWVYRQSDNHSTPAFTLYGNDAYSNQLYAPDAVACAVGQIGNLSNNSACA